MNEDEIKELKQVDAQYIGVMLEKIYSEVRATNEGLALLPTRTEFNTLRETVTDVQSDIKVIKAAVTDTSRQVHDHERRITHLEAV